MDQDLDRTRAIEVGHYWRVLALRWYVVALGVVVGLVVAVGYLALTSPTATATASVNLNVISSQPFVNAKPDSQLIDPQTEVRLATSSPVLTKVLRELGGDTSLTQLRRQTTVVALANTTVVQISFADSSKTGAVTGANDIAEEYLAYRSAAAAATVDKVVGQLSRQRALLGTELASANQRLASSKAGSVAAAQADSDRQLVNIELTSLLGQIDQLDSVDTSGGTVINNAHDSPVSVSPAHRTVLILAGLLGLIIGVVGAFVAQALDRRIDGESEVHAAGGGPVLSRLSSSRATVPAAGADLDAFRSMREHLLVRAPGAATLVLVDLTRAPWPSDVGVNLALSIAELARPVRLVLVQHAAGFLSVLHGQLGLERTSTDGADSADRAVTSYSSTLVPGLRVLVCPDRDGLNLAAFELTSLLRHDGEPDCVSIVCLPPTAARSLRLSASRLGHSIILVVGRRRTRAAELRRVVDELDTVDAAVVGTVLVPRNRHQVEPDGPAEPGESTEPAQPVEPGEASLPDDVAGEKDPGEPETPEHNAREGKSLAAVPTER